MAPNAVVALGHPFRGDDGVGLKVLELLREDKRLPKDVDLIDAAGSSMAAFHALSGRRKVLFIDCASMGGEPGECRLFRPSDVATRKTLAGLSLHEGDLLQTLEAALQLGDTAEEVLILGIEPQDVGMGAGLSEALQKRLSEYVSRVIEVFGR